ncbi:MAG: hypothetical protein AAGA48_18805 [Myxococcota bacterium]
MRHGLAVSAALLVFVTTLACVGFDQEATRWDEVAEQIEAQPAVAPIGAIVEGKAFNAMMPTDGTEGHRRVFTQEKEGYAEAEYTKGSDTVTVSISDTRDNPAARAKFANATDNVEGHPAMARGKNSTLLLVQDRFQVRVSAPHLDHAARLAWLQAVPVGKLAQLH